MIGLLVMFILAMERNQLSLIVAAPLVIGMIVVAFFGEYVVCDIDLDCRMVTLQRMRIWRTSQREFSFGELQAVSVDEVSDSEGSTYRLSFALKSGEFIPLTSISSSGKGGKKKLAQAIAQHINQVQYPPVNAALDGIVRMQHEGETEGFRWQMEIISDNDTPPRIHWETKDGRLAGGFLMVIPARRVFGMSSKNWALGFFKRMNYKHLLNFFKLSPHDLPDFEMVDILQGDQFGLKKEFMVLTDNKTIARNWLTRTRADKLMDWSRNSSLKTGFSRNKPHLLVSRQGIHLVVYGNLNKAQQLDLVVRFGADLARE
jgi:hypothetical protein